jgi:hypothetical protein
MSELERQVQAAIKEAEDRRQRLRHVAHRGDGFPLVEVQDGGSWCMAGAGSPVWMLVWTDEYGEPLSLEPVY